MNFLNRIFITASLLVASFLTEALVVTVGDDPNCDFNILNMGVSLQSAIDDANSHEIRIDLDLVYSSIVINKEIKIIGGYDDCTAAAQGIFSSNINILTNISGQNINRVITIGANAGEVVFENLSITNGFAGTQLFSESGGGIYVSGSNTTSVKIVNSEIANNTAYSGGGIFMQGSSSPPKKLTLIDTKVHNNHATDTSNSSSVTGGGGILANVVDLLIQGNSGFFLNTSESLNGQAHGGAIYALSSILTVVGGEDLPEVGFIQNTAKSKGGAIYSSFTHSTLLGNIIDINGTPTGNITAPLKFLQNQAIDDSGGAIFAEIGGSLQATDVLFVFNTAKIAGGAIGLDLAFGNGQLTIDSTPGQCWQDQACNVFTQNSAEFGGAIWSQTDITVKHALFNDNAADTGTSLILGNGSTGLLEAVVIVNEGQSNVSYSNDNILFLDNAAMTVNFSTIIENQNIVSVFDSLGTTSDMQVSNSIVYNNTIPKIISELNEGTVGFSCILANNQENGSMDIGSTNYNGLFVNVSVFDFRLKDNAYAIDFCDDLTTPPTTTDLQNFVRGYDDPTLANIFGAFDAGANEHYRYDVGVNVSGLANGATLSVLNNTEAMNVTGNGLSNFPTTLLDGRPYAVSITAQPSSPNQVCSITSNNVSSNINIMNEVIDIVCVTTQYSVSVDVSGLVNGTTLVLENNGESLTITSNGLVGFATPIDDGSNYNVIVSSQPQMPNQMCSVVSPMGTIQGNAELLTVTCTLTYNLGVDVSGLANGVTLSVLNNTEALNVTDNNPVNFTTALSDGSAYAVSITTQPSNPNQSCIITSFNSSGNINGSDVIVEITCTTLQYNVGVDVSGLVNGVTLSVLNNTEALNVTDNNPVNFATAIDDGNAYAVSITTQPSSPNQMCLITNNASGNINGSDVIVEITCTTLQYNVGVDVSGLANGVTLSVLNITEALNVTNNSPVNFATAIDDGGAYMVSITAQPSSPNQMCVITNNASGNINGSDVIVEITCTTLQYNVAVNVSGLINGTTLVLENNGESLTIVADGLDVFATLIDDGSNYNVVVSSQPQMPSQICSIVSPMGTIQGNAATLTVTCTTIQYTIGGTITGLHSGNSLVVQNNGGDDLTISNNGGFDFVTQIDDLQAYNITVLNQPVSPIQTCTVTNNSGNVSGADVISISIVCAFGDDLIFVNGFEF